MTSNPITVITSISHDDTLLPHFLKYYHWLGVRKFIIAVSDQRQLSRNVTEACADTNFDITIQDYAGMPLLTGALREHRDSLRQVYIESSAWWIPADLDELHQYPLPLAELVTQLQHGSYTHCSGVFVDRIAEDGSLQTNLPTPSLFQQYPWEAQLTRFLAKGSHRKVSIARGDVRVSMGHHLVVGNNKRFKLRSRTHHFKWRTGLLEQLTQRVKQFKEDGLKHWRESQRILDYFALHPQFDLQQIQAQRGWQPY
jgi:hypothetical protein